MIFILSKCRFLFFLNFLVSINGVAQRQTDNGFRSKFGPDYLVGFLAYTPLDYNLNPTSKYPMMIFLHGAGQKAFNPSDLSNLYKVKRNGPPLFIEEGQDFPFIVISPQCPFGDWDQITTDNYQTSEVRPGELVDEILETVKKRYRVDTNRIYITGLSVGGAAAWSYAQNYPEKVAAVMPIAGWGDFTKVCNLAKNNVAVWAFQGELDNGESIKTLVNEVNACNPVPNPKARATIYPGVGHDAWTQTYNNSGPGIAPDNIYEWFMNQSKANGSVITAYSTIELRDKSPISIYPIPAKDNLNITYYSSVNEHLMVELINEMGIQVFHKLAHTETGANTFSLDLVSFKNGTYVIKIFGEDLFYNKKILVIR